jgi:dTDP-glucose pyrophosphorylase
MGFITGAELIELATSLLKSSYGEYLLRVVESERK